ncbi:Phosphate transport system permease protein PstA [Luteitalea pratensis]|uniref:Phosphate transport system permease protein PstA n=1 Tax=Luteitalea pratensis TaxID=1855912 RepID=A0A143PKZ5_LUTPR|nr:phosphate ABC transporter permease PstA [Luteitalea pratensis]AMY08429.1 Phosphate transport system permease protein PstA [Luteitalea pratensis]
MFEAGPEVLRRLRHDRIANVVLGAVTLCIVLPLFAILGYLVVKGWPSLSIAFLLEPPRDMQTKGGIWPALIGTVYLVGVSLAIAAPVGVLAAVYLNEYARDTWFTRLIHVAVINLAGVPSIVHALFGLGAFVLAAGLGQSILAASLTLAVMTLPVIIASTRESLAAVPRSFREACWNVGATRWQTIRGVVLPNAISGILTGVILQVSRAAGETAPILFTGAVMYKVVDKGDLFPYRLTESAMALATHLYNLATQINGAPDSLQFATATVLVGAVLLINSTAVVLRAVLRNRKKW